MLKDKLFSICEDIIKLADNDGTEVLVYGEKSRLVRYALSRIHQITDVEDIRISLRVRFGKRSAVVSSSFKGDKEDLINLVRKAEKLAKLSPEDPELPELPDADKIEATLDTFDEYTANIPEEDIINIAWNVIKNTPKPFEAYGVVSGGSLEYVYLTSSGFEGYNALTDAHIKYNPMSGTHSYLVQKSARTFKEISIADVLGKVEDRLKFILDPRDAIPGKWDVILEPLAVEELINYINWVAFSGKSAVEGTSPLINKVGQKVFSENLTIIDDPLNPRGYPLPFDFEGVRKGITPVVEKGVFKNFAHDKITANKMNTNTNACALPFTNHPMFMNIHILGGNSGYDEIIRKVEKGLIITRFWYVNLVDLQTLTLTGMTRDGVFIVEDGEIKGSMKNMRFNESMFKALSNIVEVSKEEELLGNTSWYDMHFPSGIIVPYIWIKDFNFSSPTTF